MKEEKKIYSDIECILYTQDTENFVLEDKPIVMVSVITYNSSRYVKETLESIKDQTYHNLILQISDDCSTDDTIKICENWIAENNKRFIGTKIIVPEHNTGISGNINRGIDACKTEWLKFIAGDDLLKPQCIEEYIKYVIVHPDIVVAFSRVDVFGPVKERVYAVNKFFDYSFFKLSPSEQYERLIFKSNCIPASTSFFNISRLRKLKIRADERIPLLDDYPMWINMLKKGVIFRFIDKDLVCYRVGDGGISNGTSLSSRYRHSLELFNYYYLFPEFFKKNPDVAIQSIINIINKEFSMQQDIDVILRSPSYRLGNFILKPLKWMREYLHIL